MIDSYDVKRIAGIGAIQALLRSVGDCNVLKSIKVDGFLGGKTLEGLNLVANRVLGTSYYHTDIDVGNHALSTHLIQVWYNHQVSNTAVSSGFKTIVNDGFWGDETFKALQKLIMCYSIPELTTRTGTGSVATLATGLKIKAALTPKTKPNIRFGKLESLNPDAHLAQLTQELLAKAMGWDNPVVPVAQILHAGWLGTVAIDTHTNKPVGLIMYQAPDRSAGRYNFQIVGIYVETGVRNFGIGKELVKSVTDNANKQETSVWIDIRIKHQEAPFLMSFFHDNGVSVNKQR